MKLVRRCRHASIAAAIIALQFTGCGPGRVARERGSTLGAFEILDAQKAATAIEQLRVERNWASINARLSSVAYSPSQRTQTPPFPFRPMGKPVGDLKTFKLFNAKEHADYTDPKTGVIYQTAGVTFSETYSQAGNVRTTLTMLKQDGVWKLAGVESWRVGGGE